MLTWFRRLLSPPKFEIRYAEFGFGVERERRAVISSPWLLSSKKLESYVASQDPYADPWLEDRAARLLLHEEEIQITVPADASRETLAEAVHKIRGIRLQLCV